MDTSGAIGALNVHGTCGINPIESRTEMSMWAHSLVRPKLGARQEDCGYAGQDLAQRTPVPWALRRQTEGAKERVLPLDVSL